jgi:CheY-like chemotaxis protein
VLLVDDDPDFIEVFAHLLEERLRATVVTCRYPSAAAKIARERFFDIVLIDVTMNYNGTPFGGLELYKALIGRYGTASLIAYSQYITDDLLKQYDYNFNFCEKDSSSIHFADRLVTQLRILRKQQTCFVAMPFARSYDAIYDAISECVESSDYVCLRVDLTSFNRSIVEKIFSEIRSAKLVVFLATDQNPNVFYECGFAVALEKEVVTVTDVCAHLPFDVRDRNAIGYGASLDDLRKQLAFRLSQLTSAPRV